MKRIFSTVVAAALLGFLSSPAFAVDSGKAVAAQFHVQGSNKPNEFNPINTPNVGKKGGMFGNFEAIGNQEYQWQVLNIPVRVGAGKVSSPAGDKVMANYIPEITFHVYVCLEANMVDKNGKPINDKRKSIIVLNKEITYVDIPLKKAGGSVTVGTANVDSYADMMVGVFLSPYDVCRITENDTNPDTSLGGRTQPRVKVVAVAMEATYKGVSCWRTPKNEKSDFLAVDSSVSASLPDNWWKKSSAPTKGASLHCISETPFATEYYPYYCATRPLYATGAPVSSTTTESTPLADDTTPTDSVADTTDDTTATDDTGAADDSTDTGSRKRGKNNRRKNK